MMKSQVKVIKGNHKIGGTKIIAICDMSLGARCDSSETTKKQKQICYAKTTPTTTGFKNVVMP